MRMSHSPRFMRKMLNCASFGMGICTINMCFVNPNTSHCKILKINGTRDASRLRFPRLSSKNLVRLKKLLMTIKGTIIAPVMVVDFALHGSTCTRHEGVLWPKGVPHKIRTNLQMQPYPDFAAVGTPSAGGADGDAVRERRLLQDPHGGGDPELLWLDDPSVMLTHPLTVVAGRVEGLVVVDGDLQRQIHAILMSALVIHHEV